MTRTVVILPTYNEAETIEAMLDEVLASQIQPHVLVVDDSSPDGTGVLVRKWASALPQRVSLLTRPAKAGLGAAYRAGFRAALMHGADRVVQMDADGSHPIEALPALAEAADRGASLVIGSRYCPGGAVDQDWPWYRKLLSRGGNRYARTVLGVPEIRDLTGGFKMWDAELLRRMNLDGAAAAGYGFQIQTTLAAIAAGAVIAEVPILFSERRAGVSKMSTAIIIEAMRSVVRMRATGNCLTPILLDHRRSVPVDPIVRAA